MGEDVARSRLGRGLAALIGDIGTETAVLERRRGAAAEHTWPRTLDKVAESDFKHILGGHGSLQSDRVVMTGLRNYIEELTGRVEQAREKGMSVADMHQQITAAPLKALDSNGYGAYVRKSMAEGLPHFGEMPSMQALVNDNIDNIYQNLDKA